MKNRLKYSLCGLAVAALTACGDLYETHEKYLNMSEETYIGLADSLQANGGLNRIELKWKLNADPRISDCYITWNGAEQPLVIPADRTKEYMSKVIDMPQGKYIFSVVVKSKSGKESLPQTVSGESYGSEYQERLPQKGINSIEASLSGATIAWAPEEGCIRTILTYVNASGQEKEVTVEGDASSTFIPDFVAGSEFSQVSVFKPEKNAIDEIASSSKTMTFPAVYTVSKKEWDSEFHQLYTDVDHTAWGFEATTEELVGEGAVNGHVTALKDNDLATFWHTQWQGEGANPPLPQYITIDMLKQQSIQSIELARRANSGDLKGVTFSISNDKVTWEELGVLKFPSDPNPNAKILVLPQPGKGRYLQVALTESNNASNVSIAEIFFTSGKK